MGMYDNVRCEYPLPLPEYQDRTFQTKDASRNDVLGGMLDDITIAKDGTFHRACWTGRHLTPDGKRCRHRDWWSKEHDGCRGEIDGPRAEEFSGDVEFYAVAREEKPRKGWVQFKASFQGGKLSGDIEVVVHDPE